jgi:predicted AlkP superfamily pyrophosphatase or phosphodiesterase
MQKSANYTNAQVGHLDAHTAVGHMAIGTGAFPVKSAVIGNTFFSMERKDGKEKLQKSEIYATKDESKVSPEELKVESLADVLNVVNRGRSVIVSQSYALRAAIGMAGHGSSLSAPDIAAAVRSGNHVYWLDATRSRWITDTRYYALPAAAKASEPLLHFMKYYPQGYQGYQIRDTKAAFENWGVMMATPAETQLEGELLRAVIQQEIIGKKRDKDGFADLVYVSFKSADAVGHLFGYHSLEARETLAEIDAQIGKIEDFLRQHYGDHFALVLTADHGCAPLSEITGGARLTVEEVIAEIDKLLPEAVAANESLVTFMTVGQISLNKKLMAAHNITLEQVRSRIQAIRSDGKRFFKDVLTRADLGLGG